MFNPEETYLIIQNDPFLRSEYNKLKNNWINKKGLLKIIYNTWIKNANYSTPTVSILDP